MVVEPDPDMGVPRVGETRDSDPARVAVFPHGLKGDRCLYSAAFPSVGL